MKESHRGIQRPAAMIALIALPVVTITLAVNGWASGPAPDRSADVQSIDSVIAALYDTISGTPGPRDWDRLRHLCHEGARLIPCGRNSDGSTAARVLSLEEFAKASQATLDKEGFFEREIARRVDRFGSIAQVFSTYESRHNKDDAKPFVRGINSIQLFFDGKRWWVVTIFWDSERPQQEIPARYLSAGATTESGGKP